MTSVNFTSPDDSSDQHQPNEHSPNSQSDNFENLNSQSQAARFARELHQLEELFVAEGQDLEELGFVPHDEGSYLEIEAISESIDELTQILGITQSGFYESEYDDSEYSDFQTSDYDQEEELPPDPRQDLEPVDLDFEALRAYFKRDDEGNRTNTVLLVEPRLNEEEGVVWCFPEVRNNPDGTQDLELKRMPAPVAILYYTSTEGDIKLAVQYTPSAVHHIMEEASKDLSTLPESIKAKVQLLALANAYESGYSPRQFIFPRQLELQHPYGLSADKESLCVTIEPLGVYRLTMRQNPENAQIGIELDMLASFYNDPRGD